MFKASIASNTSLIDYQRFQCLKSYLFGEALTNVSDFLTNENYSEAWVKLETRYNKKTLIIRSFLNSRINTVHKLIDGADEVIRGLRALHFDQLEP